MAQHIWLCDSKKALGELPNEARVDGNCDVVAIMIAISILIQALCIGEMGSAIPCSTNPPFYSVTSSNWQQFHSNPQPINLVTDMITVLINPSFILSGFLSGFPSGFLGTNHS